MEIQAVGGYEGVGRNMTLVRADGAQLAIDCGLKLDSFLLYYGKGEKRYEDLPTEELRRIGAIPDLRVNRPVDAFLISHGHLDHIGALDRFVEGNHAQIFATKYASGLIRNRLKKHQLGRLSTIDFGQTIQVTPRLSAELVEVTHSIPQASMVDIHTSDGDVVYACDFKFDDHSKIAKTNYKKLKSLSGHVKCLVVESLNVAQEGKSPSEKVARAKVKDVMGFAHENEKLIIATTFSTHLERIQCLVAEAAKLGRKVIIAGNSYLPNCSMGEKMGLLDLPKGTIVAGKNLDAVLGHIKKNNRKEYFVLATGHQGEPDSVLSRIVDNKVKFRLEEGDCALFSSSTIPTDVNIANRSQLVDKMRNKGVRVFDDVHVTGHACREEHRKLIRMLNPENIIPAHGDLGMIAGYFGLAEEEGYRANTDVHLMRNGDTITL
jgi:ribonuclease J